jgi:transposase-like protein
MSKNKRKKLKGKRSEFSKEQKLAFLEDCQNSHLTIAEYAKANKLGKSTLYRWAVLYDIPLRDYYTKEEREIEAHNQRILDENNLTYGDVWALGDAEESKRQETLKWLKPKEQEIKETKNKSVFKRFAIWISGKDSS